MVPISGVDEIEDLNVYLYDGFQWVYAVSSCNAGGIVQTGGEGWVVPGSLNCHDGSSPPVLEIEVYHFSGIQAGLFSSAGVIDEESAGGCFIDTILAGYGMKRNVNTHHRSSFLPRHSSALAVHPVLLVGGFILMILILVFYLKRSVSAGPFGGGV